MLIILELISRALISRIRTGKRPRENSHNESRTGADDFRVSGKRSSGIYACGHGGHRLRGTTRDFHREEASKGTIRGPPTDYFRRRSSLSARP